MVQGIYRGIRYVKIITFFAIIGTGTSKLLLSTLCIFSLGIVEPVPNNKKV
jgi:hypothetical protein